MVNIEKLEKLYITENKTMHEVAKEMGIAVGTVHKYIHKYGITARPAHVGCPGYKHTEEARKKISKANKGKIISVETRKLLSESHKKGGIGFKKKRGDGYICIYFPDHPNSTNDGYIMEHILVMEAIIGRHLNKDECVHHINGVKDDNRKENLLLMTKSEHMSLHARMRWEKRRNDLSITAS